MDNQITDREFWKSYWESKTDLAVQVKGNFTFHKFFKQIIHTNHIKTAIELGGFPGYYALFLKKYFGIESTLFDYFIDESILQKVLEKNGLNTNDVKVIESDLFNCNVKNQYDLVLSCGLIEHFQDTKDIISRHLQFLKDGGILFITLPNFTGVNGWVQRTFDMSNYEKHNIKSMDPDLLVGICNGFGLTEVQSSYYGKFSVWLENKKEKSLVTRFFVRFIWVVGKTLTTIIPFNSKTLSPFIVLSARK